MSKKKGKSPPKVARRKALIEKAIKLAKGQSFDSYNAYTIYLAAMLSEYERMHAVSEYKIAGEIGEFNPPKPVSRQVFFRNPVYREIAEPAYTGRKIEGAESIKKPRTPSEIDTVLTQKDFEISELNAEMERLKSELKNIKLSTPKQASLEHLDEDFDLLRQEKSKTIQALIDILRWADGLLKLDKGQVIDRGARGDKAIVVERHLLKHCERTINEALNGFTINE